MLAERIELLRSACCGGDRGRDASPRLKRSAISCWRIPAATRKQSCCSAWHSARRAARPQAGPLLDRAAPPPTRSRTSVPGFGGAAAARPSRRSGEQYRAWLARSAGRLRRRIMRSACCWPDWARSETAIGHFRRAVAIDPGPAMGWSNLGMMLKIERRFEEAVAAHDAAVARAPEDPQIRVNRAVALLHAGRMTEAWRDYEWRLRQPGHTALPAGNAAAGPCRAGSCRTHGAGDA